MSKNCSNKGYQRPNQQLLITQALIMEKDSFKDQESSNKETIDMLIKKRKRLRKRSQINTHLILRLINVLSSIRDRTNILVRILLQKPRLNLTSEFLKRELKIKMMKSNAYLFIPQLTHYQETLENKACEQTEKTIWEIFMMFFI